MMYQKIVLIGNATTAAQVSQPEGKTAYADFTVAVNRAQGQGADFFPCRVFGKLAEGATKIEKGALVLVEGRLEIGKYTPPEGQPRTTVRVLANYVQRMERSDLVKKAGQLSSD
jgi:single stranded DNA-binding protein